MCVHMRMCTCACALILATCIAVLCNFSNSHIQSLRAVSKSCLLPLGDSSIGQSALAVVHMETCNSTHDTGLAVRGGRDLDAFISINCL